MHNNMRFNKKFESRLEKVKPVLLEALNFVRDCFPLVSRRDEYELRLVFSELLHNAVIHGNENDCCKTVCFDLELNPCEDGVCDVFCSIADEGEGFNHDSVLKKAARNDELMSEHGRGLRIVMFFTDQLDFLDGGSRISFSKRMRADG